MLTNRVGSECEEIHGVQDLGIRLGAEFGFKRANRGSKHDS